MPTWPLPKKMYECQAKKSSFFVITREKKREQIKWRNKERVNILKANFLSWFMACMLAGSDCCCSEGDDETSKIAWNDPVVHHETNHYPTAGYWKSIENRNYGAAQCDFADGDVCIDTVSSSCHSRQKDGFYYLDQYNYACGEQRTHREQPNSISSILWAILMIHTVQFTLAGTTWICLFCVKLKCVCFL